MHRMKSGPVTAMLVAGLAAVLAGCGGAAHPPAAQQAAQQPGGSASDTPTPQPTVTRWPLVLPLPAARAGLHQTRQLPSARTRLFHAEMTDLWAAVVSGRPSLARRAFFPLVAYEQVKAIADPAADWNSRLWGEFKLDVWAAHGLLGHQARRAHLVRVIVPAAQAAWIDPGVCYNGVGYWHVAGPRLVYRVAGQVRSIGIASLISWRGRWYVVHFGGVLRTGAGGMVDQPSIGPGVPGPAGGC
jgi:hypothetical protein